MGFFSKIKNAVGNLTGGNGTMAIQVSNPKVRRGESISVNFTLTATGQLGARGVFVELVATEHVKLQVEKQAAATVGTTTSGGTYTEEQTKDNETYRHVETIVATAVNMEQGTSNQYSATLQVPAEVQPTYAGVNAQHTWKVRAYADVSMGADIAAESVITVL